MNKPAKFSDLPYALQESLLWDMELDYDSYESSKAEAVHSISCGNASSRNEYIIENAYKFMKEDFLIGRAKSLLAMEEMTVNSLKEFLK